MSEYLKMNRKRFVSFPKPIDGDYVPWELDDKANAYDKVRSLGFRVPASEKFDNIEDALDGATGRFVVKGAGGHSGKNVYILEKLDDDAYLDLMATRTWGKSEILEASKRRSAAYWIREEYVESTVYGRAIPLDYKFDCFRNQVVAITQIDRNFWPPRVAIFDGAFVPLRPGVDYTLDPSRWLYGAPVIPIQASKLIDMARILSESTGSDYVRVDLFDGNETPVFGEFTFASGPPDVGMVRFSDTVLSQFDAALVGQPVKAVSGFDIDYQAFWEAARKCSDRLTDQHPAVTGRISASASFGDRRYWYQVEVAPKGKIGEHYKFCLALATIMAGDEQLNFAVQEALRVRSGFICGDARETEFVTQALTYHESRKPSGEWHIARSAQIKASRGDHEALVELKKLADNGYLYAANVYAQLTKR